ncbi:AraC family transcriptional regulator [Paenibacillus glucanolyticus]|uniref:AraC family transcriptional regulator n=1 Tax=Paenibacillus glucanolyticus TaxID=59843 RepID=A0A163E148_9BACL|nr:MULTISPECIES: helix-turn-helix domain-containing protein [Paenibacillus]KZS43539.1 AraC family transcriptional regulator [Paenibacillus glucanolyticus]MDH6670522.1 AraC family transcriptional regulator [Paenibacillus sp. LBL]
MDITFRFPNIIHTLQVTGCHFDIQPPGWSYPRHHHHLFELLYCLEGEVLQEIHRESITLRQGEWLLIKSGVPHQTSNLSNKQYGYFNVHFDLDDTEIRRSLAAAPYRHIRQQESEHSKLRAYVQELEGIVRRSQPPAHSLHPENPRAEYNLTFEDRLLLQSYTLLIIHDVLSLLKMQETLKPRHSLPAAAGTHKPSSLLAADAAHAIEEKLSSGLTEDISVAAVSKELNLSRSQCSKLFRQVYGISPRQYISRQKLSLAKELLITTHLPMTAIADKLGFRSASHFSRQFRRWTGQSPTEYRPRH